MSAEWIRASLKIEPSEFGARVADFLGDWQYGIYHLPSKSLKRMQWGDERWMELVIYGGMATYDFDYLTRLVVLAHDYGIRIELEAAAWKYIRLVFYSMDGWAKRQTDIETAIQRVRANTIAYRGQA